MDRKIVLPLLALLVVLYFVCAVAGFLRGDNLSTPDIPDWFQGVAARIPQKKATFDEVSVPNNDEACLDKVTKKLTVPANQFCYYTLATSLRPRYLLLKLDAGSNAKVEIHQPVKQNGTRRKTHEETLERGDSTELNLFTRQSKNDVIQMWVFCKDTTDECELQILE